MTSISGSAASVVASASSVYDTAQAKATELPRHGDHFQCGADGTHAYGACCLNIKYFSNGTHILVAPTDCKFYLQPLLPFQAIPSNIVPAGKNAKKNAESDEANPKYECDTKRVFGRCCEKKHSLKTCNLASAVCDLHSFDDDAEPQFKMDSFPAFGYKAEH